MNPRERRTFSAGDGEEMVEFPFSKDEWSHVSEVARTVVNATFADDAVLRASGFAELCRVLSALSEEHGEHPVLLETEADFSDDPLRRLALYEQAKVLAAAIGWPTYSIRVSLARVLLDDIGDATRAAHELAACSEEIAVYADEREREEWEELRGACASRAEVD